MNQREHPAVVLIGLGVLVWGAGMLGGMAEIVYWLKVGAWSSHSLFWLTGFVPQTVEWAGVDALLSWLWRQPLWAVVASSGFVVAIIGIFATSS